MKIAVLGAGAWGTALAIAACANAGQVHSVGLWARDPRQVRSLAQDRVNSRYLPAVAVPASLDVFHWTADPAPSLAGQDLIVIATPMAALRSVLGQLRDLQVPVVWLCKGFEKTRMQGTAAGLLAHEIAQQCAAGLQVGVLSGPSFALEVARGQPTALVAASRDPQLRADLVRAFHSPSLRVYGSDDVVGVEVGGAVKNVLAIAAGIVVGRQLGASAQAALTTRGFSELVRLGRACGARSETMAGLSGLGDLILSCSSAQSRNFALGAALGRGEPPPSGKLAEGEFTAPVLVELAASQNVDMPVSSAVAAILSGMATIDEAIESLLTRPFKAEG